ncbi:MAG: hypothetical protein HY905_03320 [Deltaproteobacteria bacterium]|nr:hypothetical protein [Deltaproteobacteria bacterium]
MVWIDAERAEGSFGPDRSLRALGPWETDPETGPFPLFMADFDELQEAINVICDSSPATDDACPLAQMLSLLGTDTRCPMQDDLTGCDPIGTFEGRMTDQVRASLDHLILTLADVDVEWVKSPIPGDDRPVLDIKYTLDVDVALADSADYFLELDWSSLSAHVLIPFHAGDAHCAGGCCAGGNCDPATRSPSMDWPGFSAEEWDHTWGSANLVMDEPLDGQDFDGFHMDWNLDIYVEYWVYPAMIAYYTFGWLPLGLWDFGAGLGCAWGWRDACEGALNVSQLFTEIWDIPDTVTDQARDGMLDLTHGVATFAASYVQFLPALGETAIRESAPAGEFSFDCLRNGCSIDLGGGRTFAVDAQPYTVVRLMEGSAGASRYWWNALAGPLEEMDSAASGARFEFADVWSGVDPATGDRRAEFALTSDLDCDELADPDDLCPLSCAPEFGGWDGDGDAIGDDCDYCRLTRRTDTLPPRWSLDYNRSPSTAVAAPSDQDADGVGTRCDLCPDRAAQLDGLLRGDEEGTIPESGGSTGGLDGDHDGVGDRCDNCETTPNRDQWNCNAQDEFLDGFLTRPSTPAAKGVGDACDPTPCVDSCRGGDLFRNEPELAWPRGDFFGAGDREPITAYVCPVGSDMTALPAVRLRTRARGCSCDPSAYLRAVRGEDLTCFREACPDDGAVGTGFDDVVDVTHGVPNDRISYVYRPLYHGAASLGFEGTPFSQTGRISYWQPTGTDETTDRVTEQKWYWIDQLCGGGTEGCTQQVRMWFKPEEVPDWMTGPFDPDRGNTYSDWHFTNADVMIHLPPDELRPPVGGGDSLTGPFDINEDGTFSPSTWVLADIIDILCWAAACPDWLEGLLFEVSGEQVAGLTVTSWTKEGNNLGWVIGSKMATGQLFDLKRASIAFAFDRNGDPNRYWTFGGVESDGNFTEEMWTGRLAVLDESGVKRYVGPEGLPVPLSKGAQPDPLNVFFELGQVPRADNWPAARAGAALACTGGVTAAAIGQCGNLCPKPEVAMGLQPPPDGVTQSAGKLILVGGEGDAGPLADIWLYDETATNTKPPGTISSNPGPWPSGWRKVGVLPAPAGGLTDAGTVQVGRNLYLVGGRNATGPVAEVYRVNLDTGLADRMPAATTTMPARMRPAVTYDAAKRSLLVFGGLDASNHPLTDLWAFDVDAGRWSQVAGTCSGTGCPVVTGSEQLVVDPRTGEVTVIGSRGTTSNGEYGWVLKDGEWRSKSEQFQEDLGADCDGDTAPETLVGARCGAGGDGFPSYGRVRCDGATTSCRTPVAPAASVWEYRMPGLRAVARHEADILTLQDRTLDRYAFDEEGRLQWVQTIDLVRAGRDVATTWEAALVADGEGVSVYRLDDGCLLAGVETCGQARRIFVEWPLAYVVGLRSILVLDVTDPAAPVTVQTVGIVPGRRGTSTTSGPACSWLDTTVDRLCDATGACGAFGRMAAAYDDRRVFLEILGSLEVIDFRTGGPPVLAGSVPVGFLKDMAAEDGFLYGNRPGRHTAVLAELPDGTWQAAGSHDVPVWVEGVVDVAPWSVRWERNRLEIARKQ